MSNLYGLYLMMCWCFLRLWV